MGKLVVAPRKPETKMGEMPIWCHHHCTKMMLVQADERSVTISASAAEVCIQRYEAGWRVSWGVVMSIDCKVDGQTWMSDRELSAAFGLEDYIHHMSGWLINHYGGDAAKQGAFIRYKNFLNIPCPGTGHDGDPNVSVDLDEEIKEAVRKLLAA